MLQFRQDWWQGVRQDGEINCDIAKANLLDIKEVFDSYEIPFVLAGGTLLGLIRSGSFIKWDHDIDLMCFNEETRHDPCKMRWVKNELENRGFYIVDSSRCRCKVDYFIRDGERVDIFWLDKIDDEWIFNNELRFPAYFYRNLETRTFFDKSFSVPRNPKEYLAYCYGQDWETPIKGATVLNLNPNRKK